MSQSNLYRGLWLSELSGVTIFSMHCQTQISSCYPSRDTEMTFQFGHTAWDLPSAPFSTARFPSFPGEKSNLVLH